MNAPLFPAVPPWVPTEVLVEIDLSELAPEIPGLGEACARLGASLGANIAAYCRDAGGRPGGLCSYYRAKSLTPAQTSELARAEQLFPEVAFVAYQSPLERLPVPDALKGGGHK
jgi:hypothetical protein